MTRVAPQSHFPRVDEIGTFHWEKSKVGSHLKDWNEGNNGYNSMTRNG